MGLKYEEAYGHGGVSLLELRVVSGKQLGKRDEVAQRLTHLLAVDRDHVVVDPVVHALLAARSHVLRDLAFVVREEEVHAAAVDIEHLAEVLLAHDRALEVPAREAFAPW